jgi:predicted nucleic acid-binding protein
MHRHEVVTSIVVYGEVIEYIKSRQDFERRRDSLRSLLQEIRPYLLSYSITERYADIRRMMRPPYGPGLIGDIDTLIAATALEANLTIVTTDRDLQRVPDLNVMLVQLRA